MAKETEDEQKEDKTPLLYASAPALRGRLDHIMREADVIKMLLQQKEANIPYKGMTDNE